MVKILSKPGGFGCGGAAPINAMSDFMYSQDDFRFLGNLPDIAGQEFVERAKQADAEAVDRILAAVGQDYVRTGLWTLVASAFGAIQRATWSCYDGLYCGLGAGNEAARVHQSDCWHRGRVATQGARPLGT